MNLKEFLKPTKGKIILFSILLLVYVIFYLIPGLLIVYKYAQAVSVEAELTQPGVAPYFTLELNPIQMFVTIIAEIIGIYLLSCIIITAKGKILKRK